MDDGWDFLYNLLKLFALVALILRLSELSDSIIGNAIPGFLLGIACFVYVFVYEIKRKKD